MHLNYIHFCLKYFLYVSTFSNFQSLRANFPNSEDPVPIPKILKRNTALIRLLLSLIWVCTVCPDISVQKLRIITVLIKQWEDNLNAIVPWRYPVDGDGSGWTVVTANAWFDGRNQSITAYWETSLKMSRLVCRRSLGTCFLKMMINWYPTN